MGGVCMCEVWVWWMGCVGKGACVDVRCARVGMVEVTCGSVYEGYGTVQVCGEYSGGQDMWADMGPCEGVWDLRVPGVCRSPELHVVALSRASPAQHHSAQHLCFSSSPQPHVTAQCRVSPTQPRNVQLLHSHQSPRLHMVAG